MPALDDALDLLHDGAGWRVALWHNLLFTMVSAPPVAAHLAAVRRGQTRLFAQEGEVGGLTLVVGLRLSRFDVSEGMRREIAQLMHVPNLRGHSAIVIESHGFAGATVRAVLGALILLSKPESPQRMFDSRVAAARYLAEHAPGGWAAPDLLAAARTFSDLP